MKLFLSLLMLAVSCSGQELMLCRGEERIPLRPAGDGRWTVTLDSVTYFILPKSELSEVAREADIAAARADAADRGLAAEDSLLHRITEFRQAVQAYAGANLALTRTGEQLTAAALDAYRDARFLAGVNPFSLLAGVSLIRLGTSVRPAASIGLVYQSLAGQVHVGPDAGALTVSWRWGL